MSLRKKTLAIIGMTVAVLVVSLFAISHVILLGSFARLEEAIAQRDVLRLKDALSLEVDQLENLARSWSDWDDTSAFVAGEEPGYVESNLGDDAFESLRLNLAAYLDCSGAVLYEKAYDLESGRAVEAPSGLWPALRDRGLASCEPEVDERTSGFLLLEENLWLVSAQPIAVSGKSASTRGTLIFGRLLTAAEFQRLAAITRLSISLHPLDALEPGSNLQRAADALLGGKEVFVLAEDANTLAGYSLLEDIFDRPIFLLQVSNEREIYRQGSNSLRYLLFSLLVVGLAIGAVTMFYLEKMILARLTALNRSVQNIADQKDNSTRLPISGDDELAMLTCEINSMLASLETAETRKKDALRESEERYMLAVAGALDGIWDWDLKHNRMYYSPRWKSMLGYEENEIGDGPEDWFSRIHPDDLPKVEIDLSAHLKGHSPHFQSEYRIRQRDGSYLWVLTRGLALRDANGFPYRMSGSQTDISSRKLAEELLVHDAFHDALTGLPNRALFLDRLGRSLERCHRHPDYLIAVLFMDLDRFKVINDSLGHAVGDQLLIAIARRLEVLLRATDTAARFGGDEFVILLEDLHSPEDAAQVAERILEDLKLPITVGEHKIFTSASIGIVLSSTGYTHPADILRDGDIAMYRAKALGKGRYEVFETFLRTRAMQRLELESRMHGALERGEFHIHYQVIQSLATNRITGFEALLRWFPRDFSPITPAEFIPIAEETGLIIPIGEWVLREACLQTRKWQKQFPCDPPLTINVNLSGAQFSHPNLVEQVERILAETELEPRSLKLELTESVFMENAKNAGSTLARLRELGVQLQIDDFGTGYSSLGYLQHFPIDTIKIDRSFVRRMGANGNNAEIVRTIVMLARELGMESVAEGVETEEQLRQLKEIGCQYGQGFYIARPVDSARASRLLRESLATFAAAGPPR